ncbi:ADOP family duplicated permease [Rhodanobacter sp. IGA1.0]|uniref:ADOP family duplicated permease n=1 Tax=Rhodanobacter sp. IGA1.0 TaxID=3158582 RepID=A0AAU7QM23_9GAMM
MIVREFRNAWRRLARRPGYALLSAMVLGVGLGVTLFLFSLVNTLILDPLPLPHPERILAVGEPSRSGHGIDTLDSDQYLALRGRLGGVDLLGAYVATGAGVEQGRGANYYQGSRVTASMMTLLGIRPLLGRGLQPADEAAGAPAVVLLGENLWRRGFNADPQIVGRAVRVNGEWATVVGVLPADATSMPVTNSQVWMPLKLLPGEHRDVWGVVRLAPGQQLAQARAQLDAWAARLQAALPTGRHTRGVIIKPWKFSFVPEDMRQWVWLMFGAAVLVLLLACVNVANLQLVQTLQRRHELALRSALGGSRARLVSGALLESLLLSLAALALALPIVHWGNRWIVSVYFKDAAGAVPLHHFGLDGRVLAAALAAALLSTALAGVIPAWRASRADLQDLLRDGGKGSGAGFARAARIMVMAEVALTVVLLVGAGTFVRAVGTVLSQPMAGAAHAAHVLTAEVMLPAADYGDDAQRIRFFDAVGERLRQGAGVVDATASDTVPGAVLGSHEDVSLPGQPQPADGWPRAQMAIVDAHFPGTYGVRLREGRFFDARDRAHSVPVAVVDAKMAAATWPHGDALGSTLVLWPGRPSARTLTVVGVIEPLQLDGVLEKPRPGLLLPLDQSVGQGPLHAVGLAVRTHAVADSAAQQLIDAVHAIEPQAAVYGMRSQAAAMAEARVGLTVLSSVFGALGLVALLLAGAGLYGVLAFAVAQRTREIGIRRAIGAGNAAIAREVGRQLLWQLGLGLGVGLLLAWPWSALLADPGLHTRAHDMRVFAPVLLTVLLVALIASLVPMIRALRVAPAVALRYE